MSKNVTSRWIPGLNTTVSSSVGTVSLFSLPSSDSSPSSYRSAFCLACSATCRTVSSYTELNFRFLITILPGPALGFMSGTYRWYWLKRQLVCGQLCGLCVWNIQIILVKMTACLWLTLLSLCLEWTVLSERQLTTGQPVQQCVWKWQTVLIRKTVPLWSTCILLCLQRAESIVMETAHFWPNCPALCLEHTKTIVRKTVHFWPKCPPLCLEHTESIVRKTVHFWPNCPPLCLEHWLQTQDACGQPTHLCEADKSGMFPNIPSCRLPLHQLHHSAVPHTHTWT